MVGGSNERCVVCIGNKVDNRSILLEKGKRAMGTMKFDDHDELRDMGHFVHMKKEVYEEHTF